MKLLKQRRWLSTAIAVLFLTLSPCSSRLPFLTLQSALAAELPATSQIATNAPIRLADNLRQQNAPASYRPDVSFTLRTDIGEGKLIFVRVGDTVELRMKNNRHSRMIHSVDLHAVTGQGGGAALTQTSPGDEKVFTFKPINPGLYVYHCATPMVAHHITNGM